ncbi:MAG: DUF4255 domain-containing protein [Leptothrix sp. (in: b-proteobacteria)]
MIDAALGLLAEELNAHLRRTFSLAEDVVVLSNLQDQDGSPVSTPNRKVVLFLAGIECETAAHRTPEWSAGGASHVTEPAPVYLNLMLMCAANFSGVHYPEALKCLSSTIKFFEGKPVFDRSNSPDMADGLDRLTLTIENLSRSEMHSLWGIHSGRYLPSVLYRVRMVTLDSQHVTRRDSVVRQPGVVTT